MEVTPEAKYKRPMSRNRLNETEAPSRERGFSLIELVILLALAGIVAGFSIPTLSSSMRRWQLASDARNIATNLTYAKFGAISQMTHCRLSFDVEGNQWSLSKYNRTTSAYALQGSPNQLSNGLANSGIQLRSDSSSAPSGFSTSSSVSITFNSRGIPIDATGKPTSNNVVYLSDAREEYAVTVSLTGKVQLWKLISGQWTAQ